MENKVLIVLSVPPAVSEWLERLVYITKPLADTVFWMR